MSEPQNFVFVCDSTIVENGSEAVFEINSREVLVVRSNEGELYAVEDNCCLLYTSPSPRDREKSRMPSSA